MLQGLRSRRSPRPRACRTRPSRAQQTRGQRGGEWARASRAILSRSAVAHTLVVHPDPNPAGRWGRRWTKRSTWRTRPRWRAPHPGHETALTCHHVRLRRAAMTRLSSIVLVLALTSCVAEVGAPEDVGESPEAVEPARDLPAVPAWKAYIGAPRGHQARYGAFSTRPDLVDGSAYVVLVPQADGGPAQPIPLFLRQAWRYGDLYFERLTQQMGLTPLDWIGILVAIRDLEEHPKLLPPTHALLVGPTFEEGAT